jgi:molybdate transport system ATP-binding protein
MHLQRCRYTGALKTVWRQIAPGPYICCRMQHLGIYLNNHTGKLQVLQSPGSGSISGNQISRTSKTLYFGNETIEELIREERIHNHIAVTSSTNTTLESMSSGEQKIAVLQYLLAQRPKTLILDDWSANMDTANAAKFETLLTEAAASVQCTQLFYRKQDLLPFIEQVLIVSLNHTHELISRQLFLQDQQAVKMEAFGPLPSTMQQTVPEWDPLVELNNVSVSYDGRPVLYDISWAIRPGEFWQLRGPNGSGKTTLISMIIGDNPKAYGQNMTLFGYKKGSGESVWDIKKNIGYFYPALLLLFKRNEAVENMLISGLTDSIGLYQPPTEAQQLVADAWLDFLGDHYRGKRFQQLTPGEQRIVMVIRAMVKEPPLLILDEPTAGLDEENANAFIQLVNHIRKHTTTAIIYISHRNEMGFVPDKIFELTPDPQGSTGKIKSAL